ncbi:MAG: GtrA family protein [Synergistaceae bacterium]|nr:GtrA family protein [Synergistaceae bacterium]
MFFLSLKKILIVPTTNVFLQLLRTIIYGFIVFLIDSSLLFLFTESGIYYLCSAAISFIIALLINFYFNRTFVFPKTNRSFCEELASYAGIALVGLALTELCLFMFTEFMGVYYIYSKFIAAVIVLLWNFSARKYWLYSTLKR